MQTRRLIRIVLSIITLALFLAHSQKILYFGFINQLENNAYDLRLNLTLPNTKDDRIVVVDLDESSLSEIGRWPWNRDIVATMMDSLFDTYNAKVVGFDVVFAERDASSGLGILEKLADTDLKENQEFVDTLDQLKPELMHDEIFAKSLENRNVVMGYYFNQDDDRTYNTLPPYLAKIEAKWSERLPIVSPKGYTGNLDILQNSALSGGFFDNPRVHDDGIFRRVPLVQQYNGYLYESLALATTRVALDSPTMTLMTAVESTKGNAGLYTAVEEIKLGEDKYIAVDEELAVLVPYRGPQRSFPYVSAADVINKRVKNPEVLKDKIVLIGTTAPGLLDLRATPVEPVYPGVEVHANIISGILDQSIKHRPAYASGFEFTQLLIVGGIMIYLITFLSPLWTSMLTLGMLILITGINMLAWKNGVVFPLASPLLFIVVLFVLQMSYGFFVESRGKRALAKLFGQYIPPELVDEMSEDPKDLVLDGESRDMTVLFSDVRGFTTISEGLDPKELTQLMNAILTPMTRIIHKHRGTIDKYMGDAIMAFWGAPLDDPYHHKNALLAAMEMIEVLEENQASYKERNWPEIKIGVGLNSGIMSVGNMGSEFRMAYTVLGDAVNLGSRLEGLTKQYGVSIIVNETTKDAVPEFEYLELDKVTVKGKDKPVTIYEPLGYSINLEKEIRSEVKRFNKAIELYRRQNWDGAETEIFSLAQNSPRKRQIYQIYLDRIMYFRNNPPGDDWDGVFRHTTK